MDFIRAMANAQLAFGPYAFRKWPRGNDRRNPINRALLESWGGVLADYASDSVDSKRAELVKRGRDLMADDREYIASIIGSTGDWKNVQIRFDRVRRLVHEVLG
jgi:hypothetical protein